VSEANKAVVLRLVDEVLNGGHLEVIDELCTSALAPAARRWIAPFRASFPDVHMEVVDLVAEGDKVVGRFVCSATHLGEWLGHAPTGRRFERVDEVSIFRLRGRLFRGGHRGGQELAVLAQPGGPGAHPRLRRGLRGKRPPTHPPPASQPSRDRPWWPRAGGARTPMRAGCHPTASSRPRMRSPRASRRRNVRPLKARDTWPTRRRSFQCSNGSSASDVAAVGPVTELRAHPSAATAALIRMSADEAGGGGR
jgi:hypothetical protein